MLAMRYTQQRAVNCSTLQEQVAEVIYSTLQEQVAGYVSSIVVV